MLVCVLWLFKHFLELYITFQGHGCPESIQHALCWRKHIFLSLLQVRLGYSHHRIKLNAPKKATETVLRKSEKTLSETVKHLSLCNPLAWEFSFTHHPLLQSGVLYRSPSEPVCVCACVCYPGVQLVVSAALSSVGDGKTSSPLSQTPSCSSVTPVNSLKLSPRAAE